MVPWVFPEQLVRQTIRISIVQIKFDLKHTTWNCRFTINDILLSINQILNHSYCLCRKSSLQLDNSHSLQLHNLTGFTISIEYCFILYTSHNSPNYFILLSLLLLINVFSTVVSYSNKCRVFNL